jgi:serine protease Do
MDLREGTGHRHAHLMIILLGVIAGCLLTGLILAVPGLHHPTAVTSVSAQPLGQADFADVAEKVLPAVVYINSDLAAPALSPQDQQLRKQMEQFFHQLPPGMRPNMPGEDEGMQESPHSRPAAGSGWVYREDGIIITNAHVVRGATKVTVQLHDRPNDPREYPATIIGIDPRSELAVLKVDAGRKLPTLTLGDSSKTRIGSWLMAVGSPFMLQQTVTVGVLSARGRVINAGESDLFRLGDLIQTDASINPGNSGGPLVNTRGEVIGINVAIASPGATMVPVNIGIGFAIPSNVAQLVLPQLIKGGKVARGWLGVVIKDLSENLREYYGVPDGGVLVTSVNPDAPASRVLQANDIVTKVEGKPIYTTYDLQSAIANTPPHTRVKMEIVRNKQTMPVTVELGEMPDKYAGLDSEKPQQPETPVQAPALKVQDITPEIAQASKLTRSKGVVIVSVGQDLRDRLKVRDIILRVDQKDVATAAEYKAAIEAARGQHRKFVVLIIERFSQDGTKMTDVVDVPLQ